MHDERLVELLELGARLLLVSPKKYARLVEAMRLLVEGQELIAGADDQLILRPERPTKTYLA